MAQAESVNSAIRPLATVASADSPRNIIAAAHAEVVAALARDCLRPLPIDIGAPDLADRAEHLNKVLAAMSGYLTAILDDAAQNVPGGLELRQIEALQFDLKAEVNGTLQQAIESLGWRVA